MPVQYLTSFFGGLALLMSWFGYGCLLNIILIPHKKFNIGLCTSLGLAFSILAGGFLNLAKLVSVLSIYLFIGIGLILFLFFLVKDFRLFVASIDRFRSFICKHKIFGFIVSFIFLLLIIRYIFAVSFFEFNRLDDNHAYLSFPIKMLQTGSLGNDPFSERRLESSLGGQYFLGAEILSFSSFKNLHLIDNGLGYLVLILLIIGMCKENKIDYHYSVALLLMAITIISPVANLTSCYIAASLFLSVFWLFYEFKGLIIFSTWGRMLLVSILLSAIVVLKSTFIPVAAVLFLGYYYINFKTNTNPLLTAREMVLSVALIFILISPWMLSMYYSSGTLLYPIFGKGYYGTAYGAFQHGIKLNFYSILRVVSESIQSFTFILPLLCFFALSLAVSSNKEIKVLRLILFSSIVGFLSIIFLIGGYALYYYSFPYILPTLIFSCLFFLDDSFDLRHNFFTGKLISLIFIAFLSGSFLQKDLMLIGEIKNDINVDGGMIKIGLMNSEMIDNKELEQYKNLQKAVPRGEMIIARLDRNYLFDFKRNPIYINDIPGGASLPPGMPLNKGSEILAEYFLKHNIKYVAYSYENEANFSRKATESMLRPHVNPLLYAQTLNSLAFQDYLVELSRTRKSVYDDGKNFVLDLSLAKNKI